MWRARFWRCTAQDSCALGAAGAWASGSLPLSPKCSPAPREIAKRQVFRNLQYWWRKLTNSPDTDSSLTLRVKTRADKTELELRDIIMQHSSARPSSSYALFSRASLFYLAVLIVGALECCVSVESIRAGRADHVPLITRMKECLEC